MKPAVVSTELVVLLQRLGERSPQRLALEHGEVRFAVAPAREARPTIAVFPLCSLVINVPCLGITTS